MGIPTRRSLGKGAVMENKSSNGWKFFALLFGGLIDALVGLYLSLINI